MRQIFVEKDYEALSQKAAFIISSFIEEGPECVLGLATGSTPQRTYALLSDLCKKGEISFKKIKTFNLDEYSGLLDSDPQSYHSIMKKNLFSKTDIDIKNTFFPTDFAPNYEKYDKKIKESKGIDFQILGIGTNGHIAFNEPGSKFFSKTRQVSLSKKTIKDNSRFFNNIKEVPKKAATMGLSTIMKAKKIMLMASGSNKSQAVFDALFGPISKKVPASILQKHKNLIVILDKKAAKKIISRKLL